jgi:hypothetical protein
LKSYESLNELTSFFSKIKEPKKAVDGLKFLSRKHGVYSLRFFRMKKHKNLGFFYKHKIKIFNTNLEFFNFYGKVKRYLGMGLSKNTIGFYNEFFKFKYGKNLFLVQYKIFIKLFKFLVSSLNILKSSELKGKVFSKTFSIFFYFYLLMKKVEHFFNKVYLIRNTIDLEKTKVDNNFLTQVLKFFKKRYRFNKIAFLRKMLYNEGIAQLSGLGLTEFLLKYFNFNKVFFYFESNLPFEISNGFRLFFSRTLRFNNFGQRYKLELLARLCSLNLIEEKGKTNVSFLFFYRFC